MSMTVLPFCAHFVTLLIAAVYWSRRAARLHSSIRGLSPQAGGFRRRSITPASVNRVSGLAQVPIERLPCVQQVLTIHLLSVSYSNTRQSFNPGYHSLFRGTRNIIPTLPRNVVAVGAKFKAQRAIGARSRRQDGGRSETLHLLVTVAKPKEVHRLGAPREQAAELETPPSWLTAR